MTARRLAFVVCLAAFSKPVAADDPKAADASAKENVVAAIDDALERLEKKDVRGFLEYYAPVEVLRELRREGRIDRVVAEVGRSPQFVEQMTTMLRSAKKGEFEVRAEGYEVVVALPTESPEEVEPPKREPLPEVELEGYDGELKQVFAAALADLESKEYAAFLLKTLPRREMREYARRDLDEAIDEVALRIEKQPAMVEAMKGDLQALAKMEPKLEADGRVAVFRREPIERGKYTVPAREVRWEKVAGHWRFQGKSAELREKIAELESAPGRELEGRKVVFERFGDDWRLRAFPR